MKLASQVVSPEDKRQALDRVLQSQIFGRAEQLRNFLSYVCDAEIAGRANEISEYAIATRALGRQSTYSPGDDSTVRGRAHDLRQKLEHFYDSEGRKESVRIALPKGSYIPVFLPVEPKHELATVPEQSSRPHVSPGFNGRSRFFMGFVTASLISGVFAVALFARLNRPDPVLREFWGPLLSRSNEVLLCLAGPPSLGLKRFRDSPKNDIFQPAPPDAAGWYGGLHLLDGGGKVYMYRRQDSPTFGDTAASLVAGRILSAARVSFHLVVESSVRPSVLRGRNVVLIGAPNYSVYAARALRMTPFSIRYDANLAEEVISDAPPESAPKHIFAAKRDEYGAIAVAYGLITVFPSDAAIEKGPRTVIASGITGAGAEGAMEFFSNSIGLGQFLDQLRKDGRKEIPDSYQVIVRCSVDRARLLNWQFVTYQVIHRPPLLE